MANEVRNKIKLLGSEESIAAFRKAVESGDTENPLSMAALETLARKHNPLFKSFTHFRGCNIPDEPNFYDVYTGDMPIFFEIYWASREFPDLEFEYLGWDISAGGPETPCFVTCAIKNGSVSQMKMTQETYFGYFRNPEYEFISAMMEKCACNCQPRPITLLKQMGLVEAPELRSQWRPRSKESASPPSSTNAETIDDPRGRTSSEEIAGAP